MERIEINSLSELSKVAKNLLTNYSKNRIFAFWGELGSGKTTFIKAICNELDIIDIASSPTFSIINEYKTSKGEQVYHMDMYRIKSLEEAFDIGIEDYLLNDNYCFIEWPEKIHDLLPSDMVSVKISSVDKNKRILEIE
jgi:tRNA threonylcarbamoyladenosine biosynthesis protein TsaE